MPVTFPVENRPAEHYQPEWREVSSNTPAPLLEGLPTKHKPARLLQSSVQGTGSVIVNANGFVGAVLTAYNKHHNIIIRWALLSLPGCPASAQFLPPDLTMSGLRSFRS